LRHTAVDKESSAVNEAAVMGREEHNGFGDFVRSRRGIFYFRRVSKMGEGSFLHRPASRMGKEVGELVFTLQEDE